MGKQTDEQFDGFPGLEADTFLEDGGLIFNPSSEEELDLLIERVNQKYFYVVLGTHGYIGHRDYDPVFNRSVIHYLTPHTFHELCGTVLVERPYLCDDNDEEPKPELLTKVWMKHPKWRHYNGVVFSPDHLVPRSKLNLWQDFRKDAKAGDCQPFLDFISEVICNLNSYHYDYVVTWMADTVQNITASNKPGVALVLRGERGTGKGFFATHFGSLFKQYFLHVTQIDHVSGKFNRHLQDCILLFADEMAGSKAAMGPLQGLITENTFMIEIKGMDAFPALNYLHLIVASNFDWVVPAGPNERRWSVFDVSTRHMQDTAYFSRLDSFMQNGGREALLDFLLKYDLSKIDLRRIPQTSALADQLISSMDDIESYWFSLLQKGRYQDPNPFCGGEAKWGATLMVKESVYQDYLKSGNGRKTERTDTAFWLRIRKKLCPSLKEARPSATGYQRAFEVPPLKEARNLFEKFFGHKFPWEEVDES